MQFLQEFTLEKQAKIVSPLFDFFKSLKFHDYETESKKGFAEFNDFNAEYDALYHSVGMKDSSTLSILELHGKDALDFLHRITTNDLKNLKAGGARNTVFTNEKGRILDAVQVINLSDVCLIIGHEGKEEALMRWINRYIIMDDVKISSGSGKYVILDFLGNQVNSYMVFLFGSGLAEIGNNRLISAKNELGHFDVLKLQAINNAGYYRIITSPEYAAALISYIMNDSSAYDFQLIGDNAYNLYRIEQGIPDTNELVAKFNPLEAGLKDWVSFTKGCFIGQEVVARLDSYDKVQRSLVGVKLGDVKPKSTQFDLSTGDTSDAGSVTSYTKSRDNGYIGLAYVRNKFAQKGTTLTTEDKNEISVTKLPFKDLV